MLKAILFDFDGVLFDDYKEHYKLYLQRYEGITKESHKRIFEGNILEAKKNLIVKDESINIKEILSDLLFKKGLRKDILEILKRLKKKYKLFIVTSTWEENLKEYFFKKGLGDLFDEILGQETERYKKVKFEIILEKYNYLKEEVLFITDTLGDILEAKEVGIRTIAIDFGFHEKERLKRGSPYKTVFSLEKLYEEIMKV